MPNKTKQNTKNSTEQICSQPLYKSQTTHHTQPTPTTQRLLAGCAGNHHHTGSGRSHGVEREPDSVLESPPPPNSSRETFYAQPKKRTHTHHPTAGAVNTCRHKKTTNTPTKRPTCCIVPHKTGIPRKEVIQPHLPVRLPCYDFVPIANPTFDHSPRTSRLGHGLRVLPTFVT